MRFEFADTTNREPNNVSNPRGVNMPSCGPRMTRSRVPPLGSDNGSGSNRGCSSPPAGQREDHVQPIGSTSPTCSARPFIGPIRLIKLVARLPNGASTSSPPRTASVALAPTLRAPNRRLVPAGSLNGSCIGTDTPFTASAN
jgi:hypothetical protein